MSPAHLPKLANVTEAPPSSDSTAFARSTTASPISEILLNGSHFDLVERRFLDSTDKLSEEVQLIDRLFGGEIAELFSKVRR